MATTREKGKIAHSEWDGIVSRHLNGESLASIARSYGCTAPAIRYIVRRKLDSKETDHDGRRRAPVLSSGASAGAPAAAALRTKLDEANLKRNSRSTLAQPAFNKAFRAHLTGEIAAFLEALGALGESDTPLHREALTDATDRLLRAAARTRIELERLE